MTSTEQALYTKLRILELERQLAIAEVGLSQVRSKSAEVRTIEDARMPLHTLQGALDNQLGYPQKIERRDGIVAFRTSRSLILKGSVLVNDRHIDDPGYKMKEWDLVRFGPRSTKGHMFTWKA